jgi:D-3-phosphoglycerate dehydrogenase
MTKVLVATEKPFAPAAVQGIREIVKNAGYELVLLEKYTDKSQLLSAVADVDALIVRSDKITREVLDAAKNLKIVVRAGAGYDNIDLDAATEKKVVAMNTPGQNANAVAELVLGMMVYHARNFFNGKSGTELKGKKLGLDAFGHVGKNVARIARGFDMQVYTYDPFVNDEEMKKQGVTPVDSVEFLFEQCEYVSLHIPANDETVRSINYALMSKLPENGVLVNAARGEVIDEDGLLKMFEERPDFAYLADIQPDCKDEIAQKYPGRYYFTPKKMGAQTEEANINAGLAAANQIRDYLDKGITTFQVNK